MAEYCKHPGCGLRIEPDPEKRTGWSHKETQAGRRADADHPATSDKAPPEPEAKDPEELRELAGEPAEAPEPEPERGLPIESPAPKRGEPRALAGWETVEAFQTAYGFQLRVAQQYREAVFRRNPGGTLLLFTLDHGEQVGKVAETGPKWFGPANFGKPVTGGVERKGLTLEEGPLLEEVERRMAADAG